MVIINFLILYNITLKKILPFFNSSFPFGHYHPLSPRDGQTDPPARSTRPAARTGRALPQPAHGSGPAWVWAPDPPPRPPNAII